MRPLRNSLGFTLIECLIAIGAVGVGAVATAKMVTVMYKSTVDTHAQSEAIALATRVIAEVEDASMNPGTEDSGLIQGGLPVSQVVSPAEIQAPLNATTRIQSVGSFAQGARTPGGVNASLLVTYEVRPCSICTTPFAGNALQSVNGVDVMVSVYNIPPFNRLTRPMHFIVRKNYQPTIASTPRY